MLQNYTVKRSSSETVITVKLDFGGLKPDYRKRIKTGVTFLDHMIEHIAWRSGINIEITAQLDEFALNHLLCEDIGITFGKAIAAYQKDSVAEGSRGYGSARAIIDEAQASADISFESRAYFNFDLHGLAMPQMTENTLSEDLHTFLDGFAQGANCTLHVDLYKGQNGHHIWEAIYRAVGTALYEALEVNKTRKGATAGVAGLIEFELQKK
ncbi:MAG: hypothetical protein Q4B96_05765 [Bacillota bacterium]|nr:hypothetical protein [Bacillota bacterium]